ncbi:hypothetical protein DOTSEDRAFT_24749 [Dothistroma septosporum NZE10]|uniref:Uncharacterized protein n=1 Tax=Dothistroma septosporum (strain NZE10 / CBS 128990) TaxID=675120 RepID=N1PPA1_DOTSN|nr:hypothetical protein DOTSEDRAFT_24749 [Dothistroma septosporum NZE10]
MCRKSRIAKSQRQCWNRRKRKGSVQSKEFPPASYPRQVADIKPAVNAEKVSEPCAAEKDAGPKKRKAENCAVKRESSKKSKNDPRHRQWTIRNMVRRRVAQLERLRAAGTGQDLDLNGFGDLDLQKMTDRAVRALQDGLRKVNHEADRKGGGPPQRGS